MDEETARLMAERGTYFVPTLTVYDLLVAHGREWGLDDHSMAKLDMVGRLGRQALEFAHRAGVKIASGADIVGPAQALKGRELAIKAEVLGPMGAISCDEDQRRTARRIRPAGYDRTWENR